ncbi:DNA polymerase III subunit alpha [Marinoscillum furvescens]|uniref:DNA-directed DNA polymerase n=1 Tax=Marinoscillum furvescens DSM 4134 TaxID=1122208 RepID=A0A3D9L7V1_MARFU|nr:DNA polymerase III subunit alpha [Marinoscillum furvescens]REE01201.1 DNA polymerase III alpha subunit [Marinoscillum furvescens DSM 4134]
MLNVHSYFSFKYGLLSIEQLLKWAQREQLKALALTDINSTAGSLDFVRQSAKYGVRPILGIDFRNNAVQQFLAIAKNNAGFQSANAFLSDHLHEGKKMPAEPEGVEQCYIIYPLHNVPARPLHGWEYVGVRPEEVTRVRFSAEVPQHKLIACPTYTLPQKDDFELHSVLRAIDLNTLVSKLEEDDVARETDVFMSRAQLLAAYEYLPEAIENLKKVVSGSEIFFDFSDDAAPQNLKTWSGSEESDYQKVRELCLKGLAYRYGAQPAFSIRRRVVTELRVIRQMGYLSYFLISWDIVKYARDQGYFYVGRGSGANSVVAYLMRITDVDPIELDLYFERFINLFRKSPPDFDMDFSSWDRDDVTRYIFERYEHVVLLATYSTFQHRAVIREVGKAFGVPAYEIEKLQKQQTKDLDHHARLILTYGHRLAGFPSHLSVHAGGILISEKPIHYFTATSLPPKGFPITHFDMLIAEDVGLYKFDVLGQRGLGKIKDALQIIKENQPDRAPIDIHDIKLFKEDELVKINLREAKAIGCFYVESPAMRMLLTKLHAEDYLTLVAASSIIRPGVAKSGMMREYILRFRIPERRKDAHPVLWSIMPDTYGIMVYQEDVIKVAHYFAGLSLAEADVLRRGMSGKYRSRKEFQQVRDKFFANCKAKGYEDQLAADVWRQIESFAGYAFAKGHSASYAIESYQSMFLKSHYPLEFMVAVINNGGGFYSREFYIHEARMHGADIQLPCVNWSEDITTIRGKTIYLGLNMIKDLEQQTVRALLVEREQNGVFMSVDDFVRRVSVSLEQLSLLVRINAFRFTGKDKKALLWHAYFLLGNTGKSQNKLSLFEPVVKRYTLPEIEHEEIEDTYDEMELLGFPLRSPFHLLRERPKRYALARHLPQCVGKVVPMLGYLVTIKNTGTARGERMHFGTFLDEEGAFIDTVHFPPVSTKYPFTGKGIYLIVGEVVEEFDAISVEVHQMKRLKYQVMNV